MASQEPLLYDSEGKPEKNTKQAKEEIGQVPRVNYKRLANTDTFVEPSDELKKLARVFLPPPIAVAKALVDLKNANKDAFQRPDDTEHSFFTRQMDHNLVATTFMRVLRQHHGTSGERSWLSRVRTTYATLRNRSSLTLSIEVLEQLAAQLRASDDLFEFVMKHSGAQFHKHAFMSEPDEGIQLASLVADSVLKVLFMLVVVDAKPHNGLCHQPIEECLGKVQIGHGHSGSYTDQSKFESKESVLPFHPEWFGDKVPLFQQQPYMNWRSEWRKDKHFTGLPTTVDNTQLCEDKLTVANMLLTALCGELKRLDQEAVMFQNKMVGLGTTFFTTVGTYLIQHFHSQTTAA